MSTTSEENIRDHNSFSTRPINVGPRRRRKNRSASPSSTIPSIQVLGEIINQALHNFFPMLHRDIDARTGFYTLYQKESEDYDKEFIKKHDDYLNTTLLFAGLFSAVASAFIIDTQKNLQEDYTKTTAALLRLVLQKMENPAATVDVNSYIWNGPPPFMVQVQAILYSSLAASLLAAFVAMLGKQWLNRYETIGNRGPLIERCHDRQLKTDGMVRWHFDLVMECLSLALQGAVVLLGYAISQYLWTINHSVAAVVLGLTVAGMVFFFLIVIASTISSNCPFQTPASRILQYIITHLGPRKPFCYISVVRDVFWNILRVLREKRVRDPESNQEPKSIFSKPPSKSALPEVLEHRCAQWLIETSASPDVVLATTKLIPGIELSSSATGMISLEYLYDAICAFSETPGGPLASKTKTEAHDAAKRFVEIYRQKRCVHSHNFHLQRLSLRTGTIPYCSPEDADLYSTLEMVRDILEGEKSVPSMSVITPGISFNHLSWILHILLYNIWEFRRDGLALPDFIYEFLHNSFSLPLVINIPPQDREPFLSDYLLAIALTVGLQIDPHDLLVEDKSQQLDIIIARLYKDLTKMFSEFTPSQDVTTSLAALRLMNVPEVADRLAKWSNQAPSREQTTSSKFISPEEKLFKAIVTSQVPDLDRWPAARLLLQLVFRTRPFYPYFKDSSSLLTFLDHHFRLELQGERHAESIGDVFVALSSPFLHPPSDFDTTHILYIAHMQNSVRSGMPIRLRRNALFFIHWLGDHDFDALGGAMEPQTRSEFCANLASVGFYRDYPRDHRYSSTYFEILLRMVNSQTWRPHLLVEQWQNLESLSDTYGDVKLLNQCISNENLLPSLSHLPDGDAITKLWLKIIWRQPFEDLPPHLGTQVRAATFELFRREGESTMVEFERLIKPDHRFAGAGLARRVVAELKTTIATRERERIFEDLCDDVDRHLRAERGAPQAPAGSPAPITRTISSQPSVIQREGIQSGHTA